MPGKWFCANNSPMTHHPLLGSLLLSTLLSACSLVVDLEECSGDSECQSEYGPSSVCIDGVCEAPKDIISGQCDVEGHPPLGPIDDPDTFTLGVLFALTGEGSGFAEPIVNAVKLAWNDFEAIGIDGRPIGLIFCDSESELEGALAAGQHLIEKAKVPAIIGAEFSSHTIQIANDYAIPNKTLMMSPSATAVLLSDLNDDDLIWRTTVSDNAQVVGLKGMIESLIDADDTLTRETAVVWILSIEGDAYSIGLRDGLTTTLDSTISINASEYPGANWEDSWYTSALSGFPVPDIVAILGFTESWDIAEQIDSDHETALAKFIMADGGRVEEEAESTNAALEGRVFGTAPRNVGDPDYTPYKNFQVKYASTYDDDPNNAQFVAHAYDAFYAVALAAAAEGFTGPEIAKGLRRLSSGEEITANQQDAQRALRVFAEGNDIDLQGASGSLDFNANGEPPEDSAIISLWCFEKGGVPERGTIVSGGTFTALDCSIVPE